MIPFGWGSGEPQTPRDTFKDFQAFSDAGRDLAALRTRGRSFDDIFERAIKANLAANDNEYPVGDEAIEIMRSRDFMAMLECWLQCNRDMLVTKLTYLES